MITSSFLGFFIWPDSIPDGAVYMLLLLFPLALLNPTWGVVQLAAIFFVWIWAFRRWKRRRRRGGPGAWNLLAWIVFGYIVTTTATNLLLYLFIDS